MPILKTWLVPQHVLQLTYTGDLTLADLHMTNAELIILLDELPDGKLHLVLTSLDLVSYPNDLYSVMSSSSTLLLHRGMGRVVAIGTENRIMRVLAGTVAKVLRKKYYEAHSIDDALAYLRREDPQLKAL